MTTFRAGSATDVGRVRSNNQDSLLVREGELFAVADGMGGHQGGEVASSLALSILEQAHDDPTTATLVKAVRTANQAVYDRASGDPELAGMGTTLTALADVDTREGPKLGIVNVGDSRLYRLREGRDLEQLTEDHSLVASLVRQGRITAEEAETHPQRNILTRALGIDQAVAVDSWEIDPVVGDRFLICSDGLFNEVDANRITATLRRYAEPDEAAAELVRLANEGGGRDNITAVVVDVVADPDTPAPTDTTPVPVVAADEDVVEADDGRSTLPADPAVDVPVPGAPTEVVPTLPADDDADADPAPRSRRFTWRVAVFALALLALVGIVLGALVWYGRNTYFVAFDGDEVAIFKGRPGGFLVFDPTVEEATGIAADDVPASEVDDLEAGVDQATLGDAERYVENLREQIAELAADEEDPAPADEDDGPSGTTTGGGAGGATGGNGTGDDTGTSTGTTAGN